MAIYFNMFQYISIYIYIYIHIYFHQFLYIFVFFYIFRYFSLYFNISSSPLPPMVLTRAVGLSLPSSKCCQSFKVVFNHIYLYFIKDTKRLYIHITFLSIYLRDFFLRQHQHQRQNIFVS